VGGVGFVHTTTVRLPSRTKRLFSKAGFGFKHFLLFPPGPWWILTLLLRRSCLTSMKILKNMTTHRLEKIIVSPSPVATHKAQAGIRDWRKFPAAIHVAIAFFLVFGNVNASLLYEGFQYDGGASFW
jgi:hypothetical protein